MPRVQPQYRRWRVTQRHARVQVLFSLAALFALAGPVAALDCIQPSATAVNGATLRAAPSASSPAIGQLRLGQVAPLIATVPRWYETRATSGQEAFVSKQSSDIVPCGDEPTPGERPEDYFELHAIDVGTGLAVLILGADFRLLYDAGTNDDLARGPDNRVASYLAAFENPITRIDHVLLSHPHRDHVELLPDVIERFEIGSFWDSGAYNDICGYRRLLSAIAQKPSIKYYTARRGAGAETLTLRAKKCYGTPEPRRSITLVHQGRIDDGVVTLGEGATMRFLYADGSKRHSFNENSLVVRVDLGTQRILFMGDAEAGGRHPPSKIPAAPSIEGKLLACCVDELKADVLVVGHHGSKTSSRAKFLNAVGAKYFVVSSGPTKYATVTLPDEDVIAELAPRGRVYRTDVEDAQCAYSPDKVGPDADGRPGGCDNIVMTFSGGLISAEYRQLAD
jgi:beta-lactamase superfamily II metal-dependent hydrolase